MVAPLSASRTMLTTSEEMRLAHGECLPAQNSKVAALVYVSALSPDAGETTSDQYAEPMTGSSGAPAAARTLRAPRELPPGT